MCMYKKFLKGQVENNYKIDNSENFLNPKTS